MGFGWLERLRLRGAGVTLPPVQYAAATGTGLRRLLSPLADPRRWATVAHGTMSLVLSTVTWSLLITWWSAVLSGLTYWFWSGWVPEEGRGLAELLDWPISNGLLYFLLSLPFIATLFPVLRGLVNLHAGLARPLLAGSSRRALAAQVTELEQRRAAAAAAETQSLRQLERDLHDGPQQRLVRLGMDLSEAERRLEEDPTLARQLLGEARLQAAETLGELRALSRGIAPPILADRGLEAAISAIVSRAALPTTVQAHLDERPALAIETAAYFVICEALTNVAKHSQASAAAIRIAAAAGEERVLQIEVEDNGVGGADPAKGHGLTGLIDRVEGLGGLLSISSPTGGPTTVRATLPWS
jgi:signal transduction histidine kinase